MFMPVAEKSQQVWRGWGGEKEKRRVGLNVVVPRGRREGHRLGRREVIWCLFYRTLTHRVSHNRGAWRFFLDYLCFDRAAG